MEAFAFLESVIARDVRPGLERAAALVTGDLERAACHLAASSTPLLIAAGWPADGLEGEGASNLSGPLGAVSLALVSQAADRRVIFIDQPWPPLLPALARAADLEIEVVPADRAEIERRFIHSGLDVAFIGCPDATRIRRHGGSRREVAEVVALLDRLATSHSIGVAHAPSEVGMGRIPIDLLAEAFADADDSRSVAATQELIVAASVHWGVWALTAAVGVVDPDLRQAASHALTPQLINHLVEVATRGETGSHGHDLSGSAPELNGFDWSIHLAMLASISHVLKTRLP